MTWTAAIGEMGTERAALLPLAAMLAEAGGPDLQPREVTADERATLARARATVRQTSARAEELRVQGERGSGLQSAHAAALTAREDLGRLERALEASNVDVAALGEVDDPAASRGSGPMANVASAFRRFVGGDPSPPDAAA